MQPYFYIQMNNLKMKFKKQFTITSKKVKFIRKNLTI